MQTEIARRLLKWYRQNARRLPWRAVPGRATEQPAEGVGDHGASLWRDIPSDTALGQVEPVLPQAAGPDPYAVWVSEIMLQQTRVETVIPYFNRWMERFPSLAELAAAPEQAVLQAWEGLGYYSRARNLHRAARQVQAELYGRLPQTAAGLRALPGIGSYTAAAVASIAFGQDEAAVDGNIRRVYARVYDLALPVRSKEGERRLQELACLNLPPGSAGDFNQALMDLGATVCTPENPVCLLCPLAELCLALQRGTQSQRPVLPVRRETPHYIVTAAVIQRGGKVMIARRPPRGLLGGLWEYPGGKLEPGEDLPQGLRREIREELGSEIVVGEKVGVFRHAYTHFKVTLHAFYCRLNGDENSGNEPQALEASELRWVGIPELPDFPMGKIDRLISRQLAQE